MTDAAVMMLSLRTDPFCLQLCSNIQNLDPALYFPHVYQVSQNTASSAYAVLL